MQDNGTRTVSLSPLEIFVLPSTAYTAFSSKFNLADIHDYAKLRSVLSIKDIAEATVVNNELCQKAPHWENGSSLGSYSRTSSLLQSQKLGEAQSLEIDCTLYHYLNDKSFVKNVLESYRIKPEGGLCEVASADDFPSGKKCTDVPYKVSIVGSSLYIIVEEGFLSFFKEKVLWLDFLRRVLKAACAVADINTVNGTEFYAQYVAALVAKK